MGKKFQRPRHKGELDDREVAGLWKAIALTRQIGESKDKERYFMALHQADLYGDLEPLKELIVRGVYEAYKKEQKLRQRVV